MNSKGQAALEYLMTYGWALVIIVVVAGILFFIMSSPAGGVSCTSSDPTKMVLSSYNVPKTGTPTVKVQNATGGNITYSYTCNRAGGANPNYGTFSCTAGSGTASAGGYITVTPAMVLGTGASVGAALDTNTNLFIGYTDYFGYNKVATISCQGTPAAP